MDFFPSPDAIPLVIVEGFLGTAGPLSWHKCVHNKQDGPLGTRMVIVTSLGPVSSLHDRACELYYSLVGGRVDYGEEHSLVNKHARYGRTFHQGHYPNWSVKHPLHFVGHSIGGPTIVKMQHLLNEGHFGEYGHPSMVLSINSVCSPFRGTQLVYILGESTTNAPEVRSFSVGGFLAKLVHVFAYISPLISSIIDVHADSRSLSYRECSATQFMKQLWRSDWATSTDAAPYDMTFVASHDRESRLEGRVFPETFYRSYVSVMPRSTCVHANNRYIPRYRSSFTHNLLFLCSVKIGSFDFRHLQPPPMFSHNTDVLREGKNKECRLSHEQIHERFSTLDGEEYRANDGIVPVFSQWHPLPCSSTKCEHFQESVDKFVACNINPSIKTLPGRWFVKAINQTDHLSLYPFIFTENRYQQAFWTELGRWLTEVDLSITGTCN